MDVAIITCAGFIVRPESCMYISISIFPLKIAVSIIFAKGAPESIVPLCKNITSKENLENKLDTFRSEGLRIIAVAKKTVEEKSKYSFDDVEKMKHFVSHLK
jgi:magnesium-transporting ATPase (P-type)